METNATFSDVTVAVTNVIADVILICACIWVFRDAKAIGSDNGRATGIVNTKPGVWAGGVFLLLIFVLPTYLVMRVRYKRLLVQRLAERQSSLLPGEEDVMETAGVWPPPPKKPAV